MACILGISSNPYSQGHRGQKKSEGETEDLSYLNEPFISMLIVFHLASVSDQIKPFFHSSKIIAKPLENDNGLRHAIRDFCVDLGNQKHQQADAYGIPTSWTQFSACETTGSAARGTHYQKKKKENITYVPPAFYQLYFG